jgi:signal recognition particle GTPase
MTITKEEMDAAIEAAVEKATSGLKTKNEELLAKLKAEKDAKAELETQKSKAEEEAALKSGDVEKITQQLTQKFSKEIDMLKGQLTEKSTRLHDVLVDSALTEALVKAKVAPQFIEVAKDHIKARNKPEVGDVDGKSTGLINGKPITDFVSEWSQSDNGKHFIAAPANGGGGSQGANGNNQVGAKKIPRSEFEAMAAADQMAHFKSGGTLTDNP